MLSKYAIIEFPVNNYTAPRIFKYKTLNGAIKFLHDRKCFLVSGTVVEDKTGQSYSIIQKNFMLYTFREEDGFSGDRKRLSSHPVIMHTTAEAEAYIKNVERI